MFFSRFPLRDPEILQKWIVFTDRGSDWKPSRWSSICSRHFVSSDFRDYLSRKCLKKYAVPSVINKPNVPFEAFSISNRQNSNSGNEEDNISLEPIDQQCIKNFEFKVNEKISSENDRSRSFNCHLCGEHIDDDYTDSIDNNEIIDLLSKCLPSIQICLALNNSKIVCSECTNHLRNYNDFIDRILSFQRSISDESGSSKILENRLNMNNSNLFIKQEPIIIKQEIIDSTSTRRGPVDLYNRNLSSGKMQFNEETRDNAFCQHCDRIFVSNAELSLHACKGLQNNHVITNAHNNNNCEIMEIITLNKPISFIDLASDEQNTNEKLVCKKEINSDMDRREFVQIEHAYAKNVTIPLQYHLKQEMDTTNDSEELGEQRVSFYNGITENYEEETNETFRCLKCNRNFNSKSVLKDHMKKLHSFKVKSCSICSTEFKSVYDFLLHKNKFHGSKYQCNKCKRKFSTHFILKNHERFSCLVDNEFYYTCKHCNKRIYNRIEIKEHTRKCNKQKKEKKTTVVSNTTISNKMNVVKHPIKRNNQINRTMKNGTDYVS